MSSPVLFQGCKSRKRRPTDRLPATVGIAVADPSEHQPVRLQLQGLKRGCVECRGPGRVGGADEAKKCDASALAAAIKFQALLRLGTIARCVVCCLWSSFECKMETETLIQAVEERKWLFDKSDENYSNRNFITSEWKKVATEVGCSGK
ncbi:hypothetical protein ElyMa_002276800 [Elysia marginata]|uniref:MADF domain-containing protein n=1 Tax=Elysia marginata TaxID=1093978 RepID=A0AAV4G140_9GAST|nr:hypothetical protein ElyMa_002276800 [Elysia marginata]